MASYWKWQAAKWGSAKGQWYVLSLARVVPEYILRRWHGNALIYLQAVVKGKTEIGALLDETYLFSYGFSFWASIRNYICTFNLLMFRMRCGVWPNMWHMSYSRGLQAVAIWGWR